VKARVQCISALSQRKKRFSEAELLARLRHYEELLNNYGTNIDRVNSDARGLDVRDEKLVSSNTSITGQNFGNAGRKTKNSTAEELEEGTPSRETPTSLEK
jgi:hypothetical protein